MKYNDNGEYKEIVVKANDTLPVGTEVDFDGNEVPSGWEETTPTIESGSNENGNYIKFADGTMICTKQVSQTITSVGQWGALYDASMNGGNWASTFVSTPRVSAVVTNSAGFVEGIYNVSTTGFDRIDIARGTNITSSNSWTPIIDIIAIGRWK